MKILALIGRRAVLLLWPLFLAALVAVGSGAGWGLVEGAVLYAWWIPALGFRRATWPRRHQNLAFGCFVGVLGSLFLALTAGAPLHLATRWPMWGCALVALLAGTAVTAAMWPAQRRFYATTAPTGGRSAAT
ncbi:hypothetical protein HUT16_33150 [Kitasatospora sp. NA04385]|uniref:hypothetical protein n=1 Tax=Kitasatospora sp. NA04385 TaxID=2742135 RepID=UPI001590C552|nr:hypothetical protein [Kitasatospora sp. NA04385]QKW23292.1 hypothetical protein HUT16_33150 [Kitasatospora sp. NA04385]